MLLAGAILACLITTPVAWAGGDLYTVPDLRKLEASFARLAENVRPSVVSITTFREYASRGGRDSLEFSQGSGFVIRADGYIATNHHVIENADRIKVVLFNGQDYDAKVVKVDRRSDLAVIRIDQRNLRVASMVDYANIRIGQWAFTVGNPFGLAQQDGASAVSVGIISKLGQSLNGRINSGENDRYYGNLIQTDASINPGNSGGPLFDIDGRVVGIATAMLSDSGVHEGIGFAIPISQRVRAILDTLVSGKPVHYGYLGVLVSTPTASKLHRLRAGKASGKGALVDEIVANVDSPAARAGLRGNDLITSYDGVKVRDHDHLIRLVGATPVGHAVDVTYLRNRRPRSTQVTLAERPVKLASKPVDPGNSPEPIVKYWRGAKLVEPTEAFLMAHDLDIEKPGICVVGCEPGTTAYRQGLREDNIIVKVNGRSIKTLKEFESAEKNAQRRLRLEMRGGHVIHMPVR